MQSGARSRRQRGFTLLEVLVALIFFALIGVVLQQVTASTVGQYRQIELKTLGMWLAENKMAALRLDDKLPKPREYKDDLEFANLDWQLVTQVKTTENPDIHRVELEVFWQDDGERRKTYNLTGFIGRY